MNIFKSFLKGILISIALLLIAGVVFVWKLLGGMCGETLLEKMPSPDGSKVIYFFESGCGATTPNKYHYFLDSKGRMNLKEMKDLNKRHEFFQRVRRGATVKWVSNNQIEVVYDPHTNRDSSVKIQKSKIKDVRIKITDTSKKSLLR